MTSFWLFLSKAFVWSFGFYDAFGYFINWILFSVVCVFFLYWCWVLISQFGNNKDKAYHSETEGKNPYYREDLYKIENSKEN